MTGPGQVLVNVADLETVFISSPEISTPDLYAARDRLKAAIPNWGCNHHRTDGGPEPVGEEHDRVYPDCPNSRLKAMHREGLL